MLLLSRKNGLTPFFKEVRVSRNSRKTAEKVCRLGPGQGAGKTAEKQQAKQPKHPKLCPSFPWLFCFIKENPKILIYQPDPPILAFFVFLTFIVLRFSLLFCASLLFFPRISRVLQRG